MNYLKSSADRLEVCPGQKVFQISFIPLATASHPVRS